MAPKRPALKDPKLMHGYTPLIGPEAWVKGGCPPHRHQSFTRCHIGKSAFYHRPYQFIIALHIAVICQLPRTKN